MKPRGVAFWSALIWREAKICCEAFDLGWSREVRGADLTCIGLKSSGGMCWTALDCTEAVEWIGEIRSALKPRLGVMGSGVERHGAKPRFVLQGRGLKPRIDLMWDGLV